MDTLVSVTAWVAVVVFGLYFYDIVVSLAGLLPMAKPTPAPAKDRPPLRFAVIVCAHNEAQVVAGVVGSIVAQDYPSDAVEVFVVADNCTDNTAEVARAAGALAFERTHPTNRTKGYALQWGMERVIERGPYDAVCVLDADNIAAPNFLATLSDYLRCGHKAIQTYLDIKNPKQSWVTRCIALSYYVSNRTWFRGRARAGLPTTLGGTGFCLAWEIFEKHRWDPGSLADDLELTMKLITERVKVSYCCHTRTFDEKPDTLKESFRQRARWMQGHNDVAIRWSARMLWQAIRRPSLNCFDATLHLLQPIRMLLAFLALVILGTVRIVSPETQDLDQAFSFAPLAGLVFAMVFVVYPLIVAATEKRLRFAIVILIPFMLYSLTWIPAMAIGLARYRKRVWTHTPHAAPSDNYELEDAGDDREREASTPTSDSKLHGDR